MSSGLIALLDDVAALAKVAAASLDDVAAQAAKAGAKAAGVVIDDAAVTPRYVVGFAASRELAIVWRIAKGSARNKLLILLPACLALGLLAPWAITPLLMLGAGFLCFEGAEKVLGAIWPHAEMHEMAPEAATDSRAFEDAKVAGAIRTDFILSAEIMAIALATVPDSSLWIQALVLAAVGLGITAAVYGAVALIVKADDAGVALAGNDRPVLSLLGLRQVAADVPAAPLDRAVAPVTRAVGRGLVRGMPVFLRLLAIIGTAAMLWVGGGIVLHGLEGYGWGGLGHALHDLAEAAAQALPSIGGAIGWGVSALGSGVFGLVLGVALVPVVTRGVVPLAALVSRGVAPASAGKRS